MQEEDFSPQLADIIHKSLNKSIHLYKATEGIIHAIEYDGERRIIIQIKNGQRFNVTVAPSGSQK